MIVGSRALWLTLLTLLALLALLLLAFESTLLSGMFGSRPSATANWQQMAHEFNRLSAQMERVSAELAKQQLTPILSDAKQPVSSSDGSAHRSVLARALNIIIHCKYICVFICFCFWIVCLRSAHLNNTSSSETTS